MKKISTYLAVSFIIISIFVGISIGYSFTPEYSFSKYDKGGMDLGPADKWVDLRYINSMISHHRAAMLVAEKISISEREEVRNISADILKNEPALIKELYQWKKDWYKDTKRVKDPTIPNLGSYNETFDLRFLNAIIAHHEAGVMMTEDISKKSSRNEILDNANIVGNFLMESGESLKKLRATWYNK